MFLGNTLYANFLAGTLCNVEDVCFKTAYRAYRRKKKEIKTKKQADMVLPVSPKVSLVTIALCLTSVTLPHELGG